MINMMREFARRCVETAAWVNSIPPQMRALIPRAAVDPERWAQAETIARSLPRRTEDVYRHLAAGLSEEMIRLAVRANVSPWDIERIMTDEARVEKARRTR